ncbi:DNRLRE domain-containing protein [Micromonospora ureilytica]|uniref:CBM96 family carbohydrate-binding protein n=1 Tax=Micromonospora ureilytica TaxID=709868 RepID=UPI002E167DEA|nr:DNRLRE domain-containing protein [Micromonospora ureilytica]
MIQRRAVLRLPFLVGAAGALPLIEQAPAYAATARPCLLVATADFAALRARAATEPWLSWRADAIERAGSMRFDGGLPDGDRAKRIAHIAGYCSLAYVLELEDAPQNAAAHATKILDMIDHLQDEIDSKPVDRTNWSLTVPPSNALFHLVLGLDVIHSSLTPAQQVRAEGQLGEIAANFANYAAFPSWTAAPVGAHGTWLAYRVSGGNTSDQAALGVAIQKLRSVLTEQSVPSGAGLGGATYVGNRLGSSGDRDSKSYFVDVLSREPGLYQNVPGYINFYQDPAHRLRMEYYAGYLTTPVTRRVPRRRLSADADITVRGGQHATVVDGVSGTLVVKVDTPDFTRESYVRFNLNGITAAEVHQVRLRLHVKDVGSAGCTVEIVRARGTWEDLSPEMAEKTSWDDRPQSARSLGTWPDLRVGAVRELNVTDAVKEALTEGARTFAIGLRSTLAGAERSVQFHSRQAENDFSELVPKLIINTTSDEYDRDEYTFGDSATTDGAVSRSARSYSAGKFETTAETGAAWSLNRVTIKPLPLLTTYALTEQVPRPGAAVPSRIFQGAGAWFLQNSHDHRALAGALWNASKAGDGHQHRDTNSLHLTAYGEHALRNSGYVGAGKAVAGFSHVMIRDLAVLSNTALIGYPDFPDDFAPPTVNNHQQSFGSGIVEDLLWGGVDYANGDSGTALANGRHRRSLVFLHPNSDTQGYWVIFDELVPTTAGTPVCVAWHPNSRSDPATGPALKDYTFDLDVEPRTTSHVKLNVFLGTPPQSASLRYGPLADWADSHQGRYLLVHYPAPTGTQKNVVTVLFPFDDSHGKAILNRVTGTGYSGATITHARGYTDCALESSGAVMVTLKNVTWQGWAAWYRTSNGDDPTQVEVPQYLVRKGSSLRWRDYGFTTTSYLSISARGKGGRVVNPTGSPISVTLYHPGLTMVRLGGVPAPQVAAGIGWRTVTVKSGSHVFELVTA